MIRDLTRGSPRAKIEVIRYGDGLAVKKSIGQPPSLHGARNIVHGSVLRSRPEIPPVLQRGPNYFIMPFVDGRRCALPVRAQLSSAAAVKRSGTSRLLRFVFAHGYDPIDSARTICSSMRLAA